MLYPVELHINLAEQYRSAENQNAATEQVILRPPSYKKLKLQAADVRNTCAYVPQSNRPRKTFLAPKKTCKKLSRSNRLI